MKQLTLIAIEGMPIIKRDDNLAELIVKALDSNKVTLTHGDILVVCQKVVSKSEGRVYDLREIEPSELARSFAEKWEKDPRAVEMVLRQTNRIVRMDRGVLIVETG